MPNFPADISIDKKREKIPDNFAKSTYGYTRRSEIPASAKMSARALFPGSQSAFAVPSICDANGTVLSAQLIFNVYLIKLRIYSHILGPAASITRGMKRTYDA